MKDNWYDRRYHVHYGTDEMMLTIGASEAIDLSLRALLNEGDEVLIPNPSYVAHQAEVHMCGGKVIPVPTHLEDGFKLRVEELFTEIFVGQTSLRDVREHIESSFWNGNR